MDVLQPFSLAGSVALVTGASSGLGRHFAEVMARAGAAVVLAARRTELLESLRSEIEDAGGRAIAVGMDVTDSASVAAAFDSAQDALGVIDVVINNAGITIPKPLVALEDDDWLGVVDTNLNGVAWVAREAARRLIEAGRGGSIVNISSITAERVQAALTNYAAAKAGVNQFTRAAALELAPHGIRVNALCPGYVVTDLTSAWFETPDGKALVERIPQRRTAELNDLNGALLLLASAAGAHMTGTTITVDGGHSISSL